MAIYQMPTGTYATRAAFAVSGGSFRDIRHFAATAILVQHPDGDIPDRRWLRYQCRSTCCGPPGTALCAYGDQDLYGEQLDSSGYDHSRLLGVLATHVHWDHVSGLDALQVPIWINSERARIRGGG